MKNIILLSFILTALIISSCSSLKKTDVHSKEEVMKMDALAMAEIKCKAEYYTLMAADSVSNITIQNKSKELNETKDELSVIFFRRYYNNTTIKTRFDNLTNTMGEKLTACKKLEEYKIMQQVIKGEKTAPKKK